MNQGKFRVKADPIIFNRCGTNNANRLKDMENPKAVYDDTSNNVLMLAGDYKERNNKLSFQLLKIISENVAPIAAILTTRIEQVGMFVSPARYKDNGIGYRVKLKDNGKERSEEYETLLKEQAIKIEEFILNCGSNKDSRRDDFDTFIRKLIRDSLTYDQAVFEKVRDDKGNLAEIVVVDASTIRAATKNYKPDKEVDELEDTEEEIAFVQVVQEQIVAHFTHKELAFSVRNPRSDVELQPYGLSEIEQIVRQLSSYLDTEEYNMRFFSQGGMAKGILNIKEGAAGFTNQRGIESFKRQWRTQVSGQQGAWKIPVLQLPGELEFINIAQSGGEMVFEKWINYLINICCAIYKIDPAEINFPNNGGVGGTGGGIFNSSNEEKYRHSKDKGLVPLLQFIQNTINKQIVAEFGEEFIFVFEGIDDKSEESIIAIDKDKVATYMTINELREEKGMQPLDGGDVILTPYYQPRGQPGGLFDGFNFDDGEDSEEETEITKSILGIDEIMEGDI